MISLSAQAQNHFELNSPHGAAVGVQEDNTNHNIGIGVTVAPGSLAASLLVSNQTLTHSTGTNTSVLGVINQLHSGSGSAFTFYAARGTNTIPDIMDLSVDRNGLVGIGIPANVSANHNINAHLYVTTPAHDADALLAVYEYNAKVASFIVAENGKVGIGTTTPNHLLDVNGNAYVKDRTNTDKLRVRYHAAAGYILQGDATGEADWVNPTSLGIGLWAASGNNIYNANTGNVGIGTSTPIASLEVSGGDAVFDASAIVHRDFYVSGTTTCFGAFNATGVASFNSDVNVNGNINASNTVNVGSQANNAGRLYLNSPALPPGAASCYILTSDPGVKAIEVQQQNQSPTTSLPYTDRFTVYADGHTVIGNVPAPNVYPVTNGYMLYVQGGVLAESFKVAPSGGPDWFDMVFDSSYALRPLADVAGYVKANHHLPEIPSADEVAKNGIDVAKMDGRLLQKIEELTLYVIQLKGEIDELKTAKK